MLTLQSLLPCPQSSATLVSVWCPTAPHTSLPCAWALFASVHTSSHSPSLVPSTAPPPAWGFPGHSCMVPADEALGDHVFSLSIPCHPVRPWHTGRRLASYGTRACGHQTVCSAARLPSALQRCFMMPQSLGVIGGKPNSAHYFIGYVGECWSCWQLKHREGVGLNLGVQCRSSTLL